MSILKRLQVPSDHEISGLRNPDLEPMPSERRIWGFWSFFGYWGVPNVTIWTWSTGSALLALGLSIGDIMGALTLGNVLICIYTCLNSEPGLKYHVGFTVSQRIVFGIYGSYFGILIRIVLSVIFYGVQSWLGGLCVVVMLSSLSSGFMNMSDRFPDSVHMTTRDFLGYLIFQIVQMGFYFMRPEHMNKYVNLSCIGTFVSFLAMLIICMVKNHGSGDLFYKDGDSSNVGWMWLYAITIWYGALSPDITNQCDYSRFGSSYKKTYLGIISSIMLTGTFVPLASLLVASATSEIYGNKIWLPTDLCLLWLQRSYSSGTRAGNFFLGLTFAASQLTFNVVANGFAGGMNLSGILPKYINIKRGAVATALLSWCVQPWNFYNSSSVFLNVMSSFGVIITPIIAINVCDFTIIRRGTLPISEAYTNRPSGSFYFFFGFNLRALMVWIISIAPGIPGLIDTAKPIQIPVGLDNFFYGSAVFSFIVPFTLYYIICTIFPYTTSCNDCHDIFDRYTAQECAILGMEPHVFNETSTITANKPIYTDPTDSCSIDTGPPR